MFKKRNCAFLLVIMFGLNVANAQDPTFSQFYAAPLYLNPAFAGTAEGPRFVLNYRNQWPGINNAYEHFAFSYDQHLPILGGGLGLLVTNDNQADGVFRNTHVSAMYSYQLRVSDNVVVKSGLNATYANHSVNTSNLIYGYDVPSGQPILDPLGANYNTSFFDFGAGALVFSNIFFAGVAVDHLTEPDQSLLGGDILLPRKYTAHLGSYFPVGKQQHNASVSPNILYQQQASFSQLNLGFYYNRGPMVLGGWYRTSFENGDSFIALLGLKYNIYKVGYSYDVVISKLRSSAAGAHEVSLAVELPPPGRRIKGKTYKRINCPSF